MPESKSSTSRIPPIQDANRADKLQSPPSRMNLYIDLDRAQLVAGPNNNGTVSTLNFKRGDTAQLQVTFQQMGSGGYTPVTLPTGTTFKFGLKAPGQYDGSFVVYSDTWTAPTGSGTATAYTLQPSFNTTTLNALLNPGGTGANDLAQVTLMGEIEWSDASGNKTSTRTFSAIVANDLIKDEQASPTIPGPAYYTAAATDAAFFALRLSGEVNLTVGQTQYTVDLTALGLVAPPQGALFNLVTPAAGANAFGAHLISSLTTATSLSIETDAAPDTANCRMVYLLIP